MDTIKLFELKKSDTVFSRIKIESSKDSANYIRRFYGDDLEMYESCFILLLDNNSNTIGYAKISQGGIVGTTVDNRIVAKYAIEALASRVILAHNHPSGNLTPSHGDKSVTEIVKKTLEVMQITLLDHIIITKDSFYSFADNFEL